jgi:hypothetical protein
LEKDLPKPEPLITHINLFTYELKVIDFNVESPRKFLIQVDAANVAAITGDAYRKQLTVLSGRAIFSKFGGCTIVHHLLW